MIPKTSALKAFDCFVLCSLAVAGGKSKQPRLQKYEYGHGLCFKGLPYAH